MSLHALQGKPVVAAIVRVFGPQLAELPLIATKNNARRQGHARILVDCFQDLLKKVGRMACRSRCVACAACRRALRRTLQVANAP